MLDKCDRIETIGNFVLPVWLN